MDRKYYLDLAGAGLRMRWAPTWFCTNRRTRRRL